MVVSCLLGVWGSLFGVCRTDLSAMVYKYARGVFNLQDCMLR